MCSNYVLWLSQQAATEEYGVRIDDAFEMLSFYPYRPSKSGAPAKPYSLAPAVTMEANGERMLRRMRWGLLPQ